MSKIIIVGSNHAGTCAVNTILENYPDNEVIVFDSNSNISFLSCGMALWIGNQIDNPDDMFYSSKVKLEKKGAKVHIETPVKKIDFKNKIVYAVSKSGEEITESYDKIILATGSSPIIPNIKGIELENVQLVKLYQNAEDVIKKLDNPSFQNIVVVGAGYIGVELAEAFKRCNKNVTLLDVSDRCLCNYYDDDFTAGMEDVLKENGVNIQLNQKVIEIKGNGKAEKVITDKQEFEADMVVLCIGFYANINLGKKDIELFKNMAYKTNTKHETNIKDVYAIGDCSTILDNSIKNSNYLALASNAIRSGTVAAHNVCGTEMHSLGVQGSNGISIWDYKMVSTGLTLEKAKKLEIDVESTFYESLQKPIFIKHDNHPVKIKIVYHKNTRVILGAQMASYYDMSMGIHMFSLAIQEELTIDKLKVLDTFFLPHFNQPYNYITKAAIKAK
ncbi:MAG: H2O-forming NADH oxidase [Oscillospiraceae bacterium]